MKLRPFDTSMSEDYSMYDKLPYRKNNDICGPDKIAMVSGNIIKFYQCQICDIYQLTGMDDLYFEKLEFHEKERAKDKSGKTEIEKLADSMLPEESIETVDEPLMAEPEDGASEDSAPDTPSDSWTPNDWSNDDF